jgi:hypothetical protein
MNDRSISRLINQISKGTISKSGAYRKLDYLVKKHGPIEMLYDVSDRTDAAYFDELLSDFRMGIYSKESIKRMIDIKANEKKLPPISYSTIAAIAAPILLALIIVISIIIWRN